MPESNTTQVPAQREAHKEEPEPARDTPGYETTDEFVLRPLPKALEEYLEWLDSTGNDLTSAMLIQ